jgi:sugar-phosphatase
MKEVHMTLAALGITDCFEVVVSADDISRSKPDPEGYQKAVRVLGLDNQDCVIVEDSPSGVQAGKAAGIDVIAVTHTHGAIELSQADVIAERLLPDLC